jgi:hypothetical protein
MSEKTHIKDPFDIRLLTLGTECIISNDSESRDE